MTTERPDQVTDQYSRLRDAILNTELPIVIRAKDPERTLTQIVGSAIVHGEDFLDDLEIRGGNEQLNGIVKNQ